MFNNNYERSLRNKFNNLNEDKNYQMKFKINNDFEQKKITKNLFFDNMNLFNQSHSNNNINRKMYEQNNSIYQNSLIQNSEKKLRELNYTNYSKFYGETNNQPYAINNQALNNLNNFQNIRNINTLNNNYQNQNSLRYKDLNYQQNQSSMSNISKELKNSNIYTNQSRRSFSEMNVRNTPRIEDINTLQNKDSFFNNRIINYSNQNFYHGKNNITPLNNNNYNYQKPSVSQSSPINNISYNIINNNMDYNSSNNTINNFYEQMKKEKERKLKEDYSEFLRQQIEEKRKRKEIEKQKEKEYDLKMEKKYQEYLLQQKEMENRNQNLFEQNTIKRPISNREKTISDIINENNINSNIINSIQNSQQSLEQEKIKNRTNYENFNNNTNDEQKTRNKKTTSQSSFLNSGKGIIDLFSKQIKTVDEFQNNFNININEIPLNNNIPNPNLQNNNINNINQDKLGFTFKNKVETEEMIDKIIKEADDYLKGTLQQSFTNTKEKETILYKMLNNGQNPNKKIEFQGTFGTNIINQNLQKTSQFNTPVNVNINNEKNDSKERKKESIRKNNENITSRRNYMNNNDENIIKKEEMKKEKKNDIINIDELLKGIDLKALNYHSKYEEKEENKNKDTIKNNENNQETNKNMEKSMKSISKLVSSKKNNETWKEKPLKENMSNKNESNDKLEKIEDQKEKSENKNIDKVIKDEIENKKKIMNFLNNRKKEKKIKYKLATPSSIQKEQEINFNTETKQQAINSSIKLNGSLNPNLKITFGNEANLLSNQSIKFNPNKPKIDNLSKFTFGQNLETAIKNNNTSIQNIYESDKEENNNEESLDDEDEEKYDIKGKNENDINYDDMFNKKEDDLKFLDFDNFLDISKINKNKSDPDDLCNIRYTPEEEQQQNKKVKEALKDAIDSLDEEETNNKKEENNKIENIINFSGENTLGIKNNENKDNSNEENDSTIKNEENSNNENQLNNKSQDKNEEKNLELKETDKNELNNNLYNNKDISDSEDNILNNLENEEENDEKTNKGINKNESEDINENNKR